MDLKDNLTMPIDLTFDDILKMGAKKGEDLLRGLVGRELNNHDKRIRALTSIKIRECKNTKVEDLIKYLTYKERK